MMGQPTTAQDRTADMSADGAEPGGCRCGEGDCPTCGDPRGHVKDMARREEMAAWCEDESPQAVTYQEAVLEGANPMEGFYG